MTMKPKSLVLTLLLGTLMLPALASARQGGERGPGPGSGRGGDQTLTDVRFLTRYLRLSSAQVTQLQGFLQTLQTAVQSARTSRSTLCQQLRTDVNASHPNPTTVGNDYLALIADRAKIQTALTAYETSVEGILTSSQLTRFQALVEAATPDHETDALPGCPPADTSSGS